MPYANDSLPFFDKSSCSVSAVSLNSWFWVTIIFSLLGSVLYILLLGIIFATPKCRGGSGVLIIHLLLVEFVVCVIFHPTWIMETYFRTCVLYPLSTPFNCASFQLVRITTIHAGNWSSFFLAVNRLVAILFPQRYPICTSKWVLILMISLSWIIALCCNLNAHLQLGQTYGGCGKRSILDGRVLYPLLSWIGVGAFTPAFLLAVIYTVIFIRLAVFYRSREGSHETNRVQTMEFRTIRSRGAIAKMLLASAIWYWICFLPVPLFVMFTPDFYQKSTTIRLWIRALFMLGYAANPLIFLAMSGDYRTGLLRLLSYVHNKRERDPPATLCTGTPTLF